MALMFNGVVKFNNFNAALLYGTEYSFNNALSSGHISPYSSATTDAPHSHQNTTPSLGLR